MTRLKKSNGTQEEFQRNKVEQSLRRSGASDDVISKTLEHVTPVEGESTSAFRARIVTELKSRSPETARRYEDGARNKAKRSGNNREGMGEGMGEDTSEGTTRSNPTNKS